MYAKLSNIGGNNAISGIRKPNLTEVRAGLVLVQPKINSKYGCCLDGDDDQDAGGGHDSRGTSFRSRRARLRTWVLPLMRVLVLAASMLCLTPTRGMGSSLAMMDMWGAAGEQKHGEDRWAPHGGQRQEHVVFVGVPEESAVLPLKALAQEMIQRGYRATLALPASFEAWAEGIPGLSFMALSTPNGSTDSKDHPHDSPLPPFHHPTSTGASSETNPTTYTATSSHCPFSARPPGPGRKTCAAHKQGLGDAWGGGVGGGWGAGLGLWRGLWGSLVGARELLYHLTKYLSFYHRQGAVMYAPLVEALRRDPPALLVADRRAIAAFRACSELGLRCVVNSAGLLGDLDKPPNAIPAPFTGFRVEGQTITHRLHSSLVRLVLSLSRLQAARDADDLSAWRHGEHEAVGFRDSVGYLSDQVMTLGNSCFGSLEHARALPPRVHMVGPLWVGTAEAERGDRFTASPGSCKTTSGTTASGGTAHADSCGGVGRAGAGDADVRGDSVEEVPEARNKGLEGDVWAWLEPEGVEGDEDAPVVVVQLGRGGGKAWGVPPNAAVGGIDGPPSWKSFREETVTQLSAVGCRTLWIGNSDSDSTDSTDFTEEQHEHDSNTSNPSTTSSTPSREGHHGGGDITAPPPPPPVRDMAEHKMTGCSSSCGSSSCARECSADRSTHSRTSCNDQAAPDGCCGDAARGVSANDTPRSGTSMVFVLEEEEEGGMARRSSELLLRVMSHRAVTVLVTDGDLRSVQAALWHGKPAVVLPTSVDQREVASRLDHLGAGVTCRPPCQPPDLVSAIVDAHDPGSRRAALRGKAMLREAGGVGRAGNMLENELHTHLAANARRDRLPCADRSGDSPRADPTRSCWSIERFQARREDRDEDWEDPAEPIHGSFPITMNDLDPEPPDDATWYPDEPEWIWRDLSWAQRYLVDVYAVYGALVMGVGLLMKLTWNLVWSLCDISTAPAHPRGNGTGTDHPHSPSSSPGKDGTANGTAVAGSKPSRGGSGKGWGGSSGGGGGTVGKHGKSGPKVHPHCHGSHGGGGSGHHTSGAAAALGGGGGSRGGGRVSTSKKMAALTNGHVHS